MLRFMEQQRLRQAILFNLFLSIVSTAAFISCGTAHQFMPPQPLEKSRWQISISWHYDLNPMSVRTNGVVPDVFGYYGLSDNIVIGTGYSIIFVPTFLSVANYNEISPGEYGLVWGHYKSFTSHDNPALELGIGYSKEVDNTWRTVQLGAGLGYSHLNMWDQQGKLWTPRLTSKLGIVGREVGVSLSHHAGIARIRMKAAFPSWPPSADTIVSFPSGDVVELAMIEDGFVKAWGLIHQSGDTTVLADPWNRWHRGFSHSTRTAKNKWAGNSLKFVSIKVGTYQYEVIVDLSAIRKAIVSGVGVTITRAPQSYVDDIEHSGWLKDASIGWGVFRYPR